jgi:prevent-host-death family protein
MGIVDLRPVLGDRVDAAYYKSDPTVITKQGKPRAGLVPYEWLVEMCKARGLPVPEESTSADVEG